MSVGPETDVPPDVNRERVQAEVQQRLPGLAERMERDNPGMHTTDTIDFEYVIEAEITLELEMAARSCSRRATPSCKTERGTAGETRLRSCAEWSSAS